MLNSDEKIVSQNLDEGNIILRKFHFWLFVFFNIRPTCLHTKSLNNSQKYLCFLKKKVCLEKARESLFKNSHLKACFVTLGQKEGGS